MKGTMVLALVLVTLAGCTRPIAAFSPRRPGTPAHREAQAVEACLGCHDPAQLPRHGSLKDCLRCHRLAPGG